MKAPITLDCNEEGRMKLFSKKNLAIWFYGWFLWQCIFVGTNLTTSHYFGFTFREVFSDVSEEMNAEYESGHSDSF